MAVYVANSFVNFQKENVFFWLFIFLIFTPLKLFFVATCAREKLTTCSFFLISAGALSNKQSTKFLPEILCAIEK